MIVIKFSSKLSFQESDDTSSISESHTESFKKQFEQTGQFIDERRETEEEQLQEPSQGIPNNSLGILSLFYMIFTSHIQHYSFYI